MCLYHGIMVGTYLADNGVFKENCVFSRKIVIITNVFTTVVSTFIIKMV